MFFVSSLNWKLLSQIETPGIVNAKIFQVVTIYVILNPKKKLKRCFVSPQSDSSAWDKFDLPISSSEGKRVSRLRLTQPCLKYEVFYTVRP